MLGVRGVLGRTQGVVRWVGRRRVGAGGGCGAVVLVVFVLEGFVQRRGNSARVRVGRGKHGARCWPDLHACHRWPWLLRAKYQRATLQENLP
jgi:hypothetical protein